MRTITYKVYEIEEHPNPEACYDWVRDNVHDLGQHEVDELLHSLEALAAEIGGKLDYSLGQVPDRGEYIKIEKPLGWKHDVLYKGWIRNLDWDTKDGDCPLTGVFWDYIVIENLQANPCGTEWSSVIDDLHQACEAAYMDDGIREIAMANNWEFTEDGRMI
jgi:hypothetical protein